MSKLTYPVNTKKYPINLLATSPTYSCMILKLIKQGSASLAVFYTSSYTHTHNERFRQQGYKILLLFGHISSLQSD